MKQAIIFDLDGTLWNAVFCFKNVYDVVMKRDHHQVAYSYEDFEGMMGFSPQDIVNKIAIDFQWNKQEAATFFKGFYLEVMEYIKTHPGKLYEREEETLSILSNQYDLYIVSNSGEGYVESYLSSYQLNQYFKGFLQAGDTGLAKAENIQKLIKEQQIDQAVYVGDTIKDYEECQKAHIPLVFAAYGFGNVPHYKYKLNQISDLISLKDKLFE